MRCARCVCCLLYNVQRRCAEVPARAPLRSWTEVMGDSREAGAEAPPAGASAQGGLSLLSQGESEEPSAQVSLPRAGLQGSGGGAPTPLERVVTVPDGPWRLPRASPAVRNRTGRQCASQVFPGKSLRPKAVLVSRSW